MFQITYKSNQLAKNGSWWSYP